jgi:hypothetical protein
MLDDYKRDAAEQELDIPTSLTFNDQTLYIKPHGSGHGVRYILHCPDLHINVSKGKLNDCVFVLRFASHFLHATEPGDVLVLAWKLAQRFLVLQPQL